MEWLKLSPMRMMMYFMALVHQKSVNHVRRLRMWFKKWSTHSHRFKFGTSSCSNKQVSLRLPKKFVLLLGSEQESLAISCGWFIPFTEYWIAPQGNLGLVSLILDHIGSIHSGTLSTWFEDSFSRLMAERHLNGTTGDWGNHPRSCQTCCWTSFSLVQLVAINTGQKS